MSRLPRLVCAIGMAVLLVACAPPADDVAEVTPPVASPTTTPTTAPAPAPTGTAEGAEAGPASVPDALDWTLPALDGGQVVGAELAGRAVALWFWTPW